MNFLIQHPKPERIEREAPKSVVLRIKRRANPDSPQYWEEFEIPYRPSLNIILCLMDIRKNSFTKDGKPTTPVCLGYELPRTGLRHLHDDYQRAGASSVFRAC